MLQLLIVRRQEILHYNNFCPDDSNTKLVKASQEEKEPVYTAASSHQTAALSPNLYN